MGRSRAAVLQATIRAKSEALASCKNFMEYIGSTTDETAEHSGSKRIRQIHRKVSKIRRSEKAGLRLMQKWEELAYEREEGLKEGVARGIIETALECGISEGKILEKLRDKLQIAPEEAQKYLDRYMEKN